MYHVPFVLLLSLNPSSRTQTFELLSKCNEHCVLEYILDWRRTLEVGSLPIVIGESFPEKVYFKVEFCFEKQNSIVTLLLPL
jgi:hypothetical protein